MEVFRLFWLGKLQPVQGRTDVDVYNYLQNAINYFGEKSLPDYSVETNYRTFTGAEFLEYYKNKNQKK
jgi:hypothetical protein